MIDWMIDWWLIADWSNDAVIELMFCTLQQLSTRRMSTIKLFFYFSIENTFLWFLPIFVLRFKIGFSFRQLFSSRLFVNLLKLFLIYLQINLFKLLAFKLFKLHKDDHEWNFKSINLNMNVHPENINTLKYEGTELVLDVSGWCGCDVHRQCSFHRWNCS